MRAIEPTTLDDYRSLVRRFAHDIQGCLAAIQGGAECIVADTTPPPGPEQIESYVRDIQGFAQLGMRLARECSIAGRETLELRREPVALLHEVILPLWTRLRHVRGMLRQSTSLAHQGFENLPRLPVDRALIEQLFHSLFAFLLRAPRAAGMPCRIALEVQQDGNDVRIRCLTSPHVRGQAAPRDARAEPPGARSGPGGVWEDLSLTVVQKLAEAHGGRLVLPGEEPGNDLLISLPLHVSERIGIEDRR